MTRYEAIKIALDLLRDDDIAIFTTGMISREAFKIKDRECNFYMLGSMGLASSLALGLALNIERRIFVLDGDGSVLMDLGAMSMMGFKKPDNLIHIVLDNEMYQSTGGQPTVSGIAKLDKVALDLGYNGSVKVESAEGLNDVLKNISDRKGPYFILVKALGKIEDEPPRVNLTPLQIKHRFMQALKNR